MPEFQPTAGFLAGTAQSASKPEPPGAPISYARGQPLKPHHVRDWLRSSDPATVANLAYKMDPQFKSLTDSYLVRAQEMSPQLQKELPRLLLTDHYKLDVAETDDVTSQMADAVTKPGIFSHVGSYIGETLSNVPKDAVANVSNLYQAVRHPIQTAKGLATLGVGTAANTVETLAGSFMDDAEEIFNAPGEELASAVGSQAVHAVAHPLETLKNAPVSTLMTVLPVAGQAAKASGLSKAARAASVANPASAAGGAARTLRTVLKKSGAILTNVGDDTLERAYQFPDVMAKAITKVSQNPNQPYLGLAEAVTKRFIKLRQDAKDNFARAKLAFKEQNPDTRFDLSGAADDAAKKLSEFNIAVRGSQRPIRTLQDDISKLSEELAARKAYLKDNGEVGALSRFANRKTKELPEVTGQGSTFARTGDDVAMHLGAEDSEALRGRFDAITKEKERVAELERTLVQRKGELKAVKKQGDLALDQGKARPLSDAELNALRDLYRTIEEASDYSIDDVADLKKAFNKAYDAIPLSDLKEPKLYHKIVMGMKEGVDERITSVLPNEIQDAYRQLAKTADLQGKFGSKLLTRMGGKKVMSESAESYMRSIAQMNKGQRRNLVKELSEATGLDIEQFVQFTNDAIKLSKAFPETGSRTLDVIRGILSQAAVPAGFIAGGIPGAAAGAAGIAATSPAVVGKVAMLAGKLAKTPGMQNVARLIESLPPAEQVALFGAIQEILTPER